MLERSLRGMAARKLSGALCLAATPVFAAMALLTGLTGGPADMICGPDAAAFGWLGGMAPMYGLMAAVHAAPWLRLLAR